jgi:regulator of sigma E protease
MELAFGIILGIIVLIVLVVVHELGHAITAFRNGVVVEEFGIGFPPKALSKKLKNGTTISLNWLPLGGFVKLQGEYDEASKKGDYGAATYYKKTKILLAGVVMNWLLAVVLLTILALIGLPKALPDQITIPSDTIIINQPIEITSLIKGYPAEKAGFQVRDKIIKFAGKNISTSSHLTELAKQHKGQKVDVLYSRNGLEHTKQVTLKDKVKSGFFGAVLGQMVLVKATWSAPFVGVATTTQFSWVTLCGVGNMVGNLVNSLVLQFNPNANVREQASQRLKTVSDDVAGPIGILGTIFPAAEQSGPTQLIFLTAIISLTLAVMNILPIPALDGGRWLTMTLYKLMKKKLTKQREETIQTIGFSVLLVLIILVTIIDVTRLF